MQKPVIEELLGAEYKLALNNLRDGIINQESFIDITQWLHEMRQTEPLSIKAKNTLKQWFKTIF